jgi:mannose-6-phosphate isomerase-like protein (cupin superfamily)
VLHLDSKPEVKPALRLDEHGGEEFLYVLRGEIEMEFAHRKVRLKAGDSIYFEGHLPHRQRSLAADTATLIVIEGRDS